MEEAPRYKLATLFALLKMFSTICTVYTMDWTGWSG